MYSKGRAAFSKHARGGIAGSRRTGGVRVLFRQRPEDGALTDPGASQHPSLPELGSGRQGPGWRDLPLSDQETRVGNQPLASRGHSSVSPRVGCRAGALGLWPLLRVASTRPETSEGPLPAGRPRPRLGFRGRAARPPQKQGRGGWGSVLALTPNAGSRPWGLGKTLSGVLEFLQG